MYIHASFLLKKILFYADSGNFPSDDPSHSQTGLIPASGCSSMTVYFKSLPHCETVENSCFRRVVEMIDFSRLDFHCLVIVNKLSYTSCSASTASLVHRNTAQLGKRNICLSSESKLQKDWLTDFCKVPGFFNQNQQVALQSQGKQSCKLRWLCLINCSTQENFPCVFSRRSNQNVLLQIRLCSLVRKYNSHFYRRELWKIQVKKFTPFIVSK